jgi:hypothetical protein
VYMLAPARRVGDVVIADGATAAGQ